MQSATLRSLCYQFYKVCWKEQPHLFCYMAGPKYLENSCAGSQDWSLHFSGCSSLLRSAGQSHFLSGQWLLCGAWLPLPSLWIFATLIRESVFIVNMGGGFLRQEAVFRLLPLGTKSWCSVWHVLLVCRSGSSKFSPLFSQTVMY